MSSMADYSEFADGLRARRARAERVTVDIFRQLGDVLPLGDGARVLEASHAVSRVLNDLDEAESEIRSQNEALCEARLALEEEARRYLTLFDLAPVAYLATSESALIEHANEATSTLLGMPKNALARKPLACFVAPDDQLEFRAAVRRSAESTTVQIWPLKLCPRRGEPLDCRVRVRAVREPHRAAPLLLWHIEEDRGAEDLF